MASNRGHPLGADEFAALMAACGPFEDRPHLAVALSGGPDSLALTLLLRDWLKPLGGRLTALTVDHGLRAASADEAAHVARWMGQLGVEHHVLPWEGEKPESGLMAAAREARYRLLNAWCRERGVLHLALAHQLEDQAATFLMRLKRGSGLDGLAAMPAVTEGLPRLLRPVLGISRERLKATLSAAGRSWIEDPSNDNPAFERTSMTAFVSGENALGLTAERVALAADALLRARRALDEAIAQCLAECATVDPLGVADVHTGPLMTASEDVRLRSMARLLRTVGGEGYTPRLERLARLVSAIGDGELGRGRTLAGCRIVPHGNTGIRLMREAAAVEADRPVPGPDFLWDRRFRIMLSGVETVEGLSVGRLDADRWQALRAEQGADGNLRAAVRATLPVLVDGRGIAAAPHLGYRRADWAGEAAAIFMPAHPLA